MENKFEPIYEVIRIKQELKKLPKKYQDLEGYTIRSPHDVKRLVRLVTKLIGDEDREVFLVIGLNTKNNVIAVHRAHIGSINSSIVHPREVFKMAILNNCASIIVAHCHPSGSPFESPEDIAVTQRLYECGNLMGIELLDHLIVTMDCEKFCSLKEKGFI